MPLIPSSSTESKFIAPRCVNLDWLEVFTHEPANSPRDAVYYMSKGWVVHEREYGTRVYKEMFILDGTDGESLLEIRRNPASQGLSGIFDGTECHIRLRNRTCYFEDAAAQLDRFLSENGYKDSRISRVDVCLDFIKFDKGDEPQAFIRRYMRHKYSKINQGRVTSHGEDTWTSKEWNSLSWGSKTSAVSTKMYNKTMELYDVKTDSFAKPYIRQQWLECGFIDNVSRVTKDGQLVQVWRVEFSIKSAVKGWMAIEIDGKEKNYQSIRNTLDCYKGRDRLLVIFASLANHYFHFKKYRKNQRKDRCPDKILFDFSGQQRVYKIEMPNSLMGSEESMRQQYARLISQLRLFQQGHPQLEIYHACDMLINAMQDDDLRAQVASQWSREQIDQLRHLLSYRVKYPNEGVDAALAVIKHLLGITDRTIKVF